MANNIEEIVIDIELDGTVTVEGKNFVGPECKQLTKALEEDLGVVTSVVEKPEMRQTKTKTVARTARR